MSKWRLQAVAFGYGVCERKVALGPTSPEL